LNNHNSYRSTIPDIVLQSTVKPTVAVAGAGLVGKIPEVVWWVLQIAVIFFGLLIGSIVISVVLARIVTKALGETRIGVNG
jgi:hypothetical protein